jgi:hypothetical protein
MILSQLQGAVGDPRLEECQNSQLTPPSKSFLPTRRGYLTKETEP